MDYFAFTLRAAGAASVNPLIYGILDKTLQPFGKCSSKKKHVQRFLYKTDRSEEQAMHFR